MNIGLAILAVVVAYLCGMLPSAILIAKSKGVDITTVGSGNPGASNVARALGTKYGIFVFALDALKGAVPVAIIMISDRPVAYACAAAAVLGHVFPITRKFKGGKGVATGAADGFARMAGVPALTLLHLGPGYLNGGANIHNARRAYSPVINLIGDHAVSHRNLDAPLASDIAGLAAPNSRWLRSVDRVQDAGRRAAEAFAASYGPPPGPVSLIMPADTAWTKGGSIFRTETTPGLRQASDGLIEERGLVEVGCEFCGVQYRFDAVDVGEMFTPDGRQPPTSTAVQ